MNQSQDILNLVDKQVSQEFENNHPCFKAIINTVWWLAFQSYDFRSHDEIRGSKYQGNFIKLLKLIRSHNDKLYRLILKMLLVKMFNTLLIKFKRKVRLSLLAMCKWWFMMRLSIQSIIVDEARNEVEEEQIAIILWIFWQWWFHFIAFFSYCACKRYYDVDSKTRNVQCFISL